MTDTNFQGLGLADELLAAINAAGYSVPTPIQAQSIPPLLAGKDLLGLAETGTGKTAAFTLPILQKLSQAKEPVAPRCCRALILAPTRELAIQIGESVETYGKGYKLSHTVIFGGVGPRPQIRAMDRGVDILIATPGRLLDLMGTRNVRLDRVQFFVLDEADRMLDMGFIRDVKRIIKELPKVRQSLLFSATMPEDISSLAHEILHNPVRVEVARAGKTVDRIEQFVHFVDTKSKRAVLAALLKDEAMRRVIVFTRTKHGADRVARGLGASGVGAYAIHGNKSQNARQAALESFRNGKARVLVATDIAARGIDIDEISHVVNFDIPNIPESYVHRIGRTARAGHTGVAIALCAPEERAYLRDIERLTRRSLVQAPAIAGLAEVAASLPPVPTRSPEREDGETFERGRGRVAGRRHMPRVRPATAWREGDADRPIEAGGFNAQREREGDDRGAQRGRHERRNDGNGASRHPQRSDRGDRGPTRFHHNDGQGDRRVRPFSNEQQRDSRGGRPHGDRQHEHAGRDERKHGSGGDKSRFVSRERTNGGRDGERPVRDGQRQDRPREARSGNGPRPHGDGRPAGQGDRGFGDRREHREHRDHVGRGRPARPEGDRGPDRGQSAKPWNRSERGGEPARSNEGPRGRDGARGSDAARGNNRSEGQRSHQGRPPHRWGQGGRGGDVPRSQPRDRAKPE